MMKWNIMICSIEQNKLTCMNWIEKYCKKGEGVLFCYPDRTVTNESYSINEIDLLNSIKKKYRLISFTYTLNTSELSKKILKEFLERNSKLRSSMIHAFSEVGVIFSEKELYELYRMDLFEQMHRMKQYVVSHDLTINKVIAIGIEAIPCICTISNSMLYKSNIERIAEVEDISSMIATEIIDYKVKQAILKKYSMYFHKINNISI